MRTMRRSSGILVPVVLLGLGCFCAPDCRSEEERQESEQINYLKHIKAEKLEPVKLGEGPGQSPTLAQNAKAFTAKRRPDRELPMRADAQLRAPGVLWAAARAAREAGEVSKGPTLVICQLRLSRIKHHDGIGSPEFLFNTWFGEQRWRFETESYDIKSRSNYHLFTSAPGIVLEEGQKVGLSVGEADLKLKGSVIPVPRRNVETVARAEGTFQGWPVELEGEGLEVDCLPVPRQRVETFVPRAAALIKKTQEGFGGLDYAAKEPAKSYRAMERASRRAAQGIEALAALLGWADPRVEEQLDALIELQRRTLARWSTQREEAFALMKPPGEPMQLELGKVVLELRVGALRCRVLSSHKQRCETELVIKHLRGKDSLRLRRSRVSSVRHNKCQHSWRTTKGVVGFSSCLVVAQDMRHEDFYRPLGGKFPGGKEEGSLAPGEELTLTWSAGVRGPAQRKLRAIRINLGEETLWTRVQPEVLPPAWESRSGDGAPAEGSAKP